MLCARAGPLTASMARDDVHDGGGLRPPKQRRYSGGLSVCIARAGPGRMAKLLLGWAYWWASRPAALVPCLICLAALQG